MVCFSRARGPRDRLAPRRPDAGAESHARSVPDEPPPRPPGIALTVGVGVSESPSRDLRVLAADEDRAALASLAQSLRALGHEVLDLAVEAEEVAEAVAREDPDVSVVKVHADREHALELIGELTSFASGAVVVLMDEADPDFVAAAADEGVHAYAAGADAAELQGALEVALRRHAEVTALEEKVEQLETALDRRAVIERAKGMLMERHGLDDRAAFELLRRTARNSGRQVVAVAREVIDGRSPA
jgi:AmiR/NasT family two-component response regulator